MNSSRITTAIVPNSFFKCIDAVRESMDSVEPDTVVMMGEYTGRAVVTVERIAQNLNDGNRYGLLDNDGVAMQDQVNSMSRPSTYPQQSVALELDLPAPMPVRRRPEPTAEFAARYGYDRWTTDLAEALADPAVDAVQGFLAASRGNTQAAGLLLDARADVESLLAADPELAMVWNQSLLLTVLGGAALLQSSWSHLVTAAAAVYWLVIFLGLAGLLLPGLQGILLLILGAAILSVASDTVHRWLENLLEHRPKLLKRLNTFRNKLHSKLSRPD